MPNFSETGPFTPFIVLARIAGDDVVALKSSCAHSIRDEMQSLLDRAGIFASTRSRGD